MLKVRDRIIVREAFDDNYSIVGKLGTVLKYHSRNALVEFDEFIEGGHSGEGEGEYGKCWWINIDALEKIDEKLTIKEKIQIRCEHLYSFQSRR